MAAWKEWRGDFERENQLAKATRPTFQALSPAGQRALFVVLTHIANSSRRPGFPQKDLAVEILTDPAYAAVVGEVVRECLVEEAAGLDLTDSIVDRRSQLRYLYREVAALLGERFNELLLDVLPDDQSAA